jgi:cell shape-determining protein MreC
MLSSGHRQKIREVVIIMAAFLAALFLLRQSARSPEYLSPVDRGILAMVTPLQSRMARLARSIGHAAGQYVDLVHVRAENEGLRKRPPPRRAAGGQARRR